MTQHRTCDGMLRRDCLRAGMLGVGGLTLSSFLRLADAGEVTAGRAQQAIFIELPGGPSHLDTFDPKPNAPDNVRGKFKPIATNVLAFKFRSTCQTWQSVPISLRYFVALVIRWQRMS